MENNAKMIESLIESATEYGKTSFELVKLRVLDKSSDAVSSFAAKFVVMVFVMSFMLFFNLGLALWIGEIIGQTYYGFFIVAAFYGITGIFFHFVMRKWLKKVVCNNFIEQVLK